MRLVVCSLRLWALLALAVCYLPSVTYGAPALNLPEPAGTHIYDAGLKLLRLGDYYGAITELKRFTLLFPQHAFHPAAQVLLGLALQEEETYDDAFLHFERLRQVDEPLEVGQIAAFKLGELRFLQQQYRQAIGHLQSFLATFPESPLSTRGLYLLGLSLALDGQNGQARQVLGTLPSHDPLAQRALALQEELRLSPLPPQKSPGYAGVLAGILPGAGHLYAGKPWQALTAFVLNGVFLAGAAYAVHEGFETTGAILLFFETGWYLGNIQSAMEAARQANRQYQRNLVQHLRATYAPPTLTLRELQTPTLGLRLTF